jgi:hypothetical protein
LTQNFHPINILQQQLFGLHQLKNPFASLKAHALMKAKLSNLNVKHRQALHRAALPANVRYWG